MLFGDVEGAGAAEEVEVLDFSLADSEFSVEVIDASIFALTEAVVLEV